MELLLLLWFDTIQLFSSWKINKLTYSSSWKCFFSFWQTNSFFILLLVKTFLHLTNIFFLILSSRTISSLPDKLFSFLMNIFLLFPRAQRQANIQLTCNSGPKGLAWFVPSEATAQTMTTRIVRLNWLLYRSPPRRHCLSQGWRRQFLYPVSHQS